MSALPLAELSESGAAQSVIQTSLPGLVTPRAEKALSLKTVWMPVGKRGSTALPVWDEQLTVVNVPAQDVPTWKRNVAVDPAREIVPGGETADLPGFPGSRHSSVPRAAVSIWL